MKAGDLITLALLAGVGWVMYQHFGQGKTWGQALPFGLGPTFGIQGLGCGACCDLDYCIGQGSCARGMGLGVLAATPYLSTARQTGAGVATRAERMIVA